MHNILYVRGYSKSKNLYTVEYGVWNQSSQKLDRNMVHSFWYTLFHIER